MKKLSLAVAIVVFALLVTSAVVNTVRANPYPRLRVGQLYVDELGLTTDGGSTFYDSVTHAGSRAVLKVGARGIWTDGGIHATGVSDIGLKAATIAACDSSCTATVTAGSVCACSYSVAATGRAPVYCAVSSTTLTITTFPDAGASYVCYVNQ